MRMIALSVLIIVCFGQNLFAAKQPNFLIIMADDCTYNDLPLYGGQNAKTPNIDRLASQGLTFNRAYLSEAMCQPCRAELYTGRYPLGNGCAWNHSASLESMTGMPQHLSALGYRVGLAGKVHVKPTSAFPFESVTGFDKNCVRNPTLNHSLAGVSEFMARDNQQPFCLVVALVEPHVPWVMGDASAYPPAELKLPPNIADTERTRQDFSNYLAEITYMDGQVGELLEALQESGQADNTLVLFTSEQGSQFPGNKWTNWNTGVHTALVASWPGKVPAGQRTDALVQYCDVAPTLVQAAGGKAGDGFDGSSFLEVLTGQADQHRQVDPRDHLYLAFLQQRDGEVGRRAAEQVGQHDHTLAAIDFGDLRADFLAARRGIVLRADADGRNRLLRADHMFHRRNELTRQLPVRHQNEANHGVTV